jgi:F-type H+-transporting ATPase subunit a
MAAGHSEHGPDVFHHVRDNTVFELPQALGGEWHIPQPFGESFAITKFMVLEVVAGLLVLWIFTTLARKAAAGQPIRGRFWNFWEAIALYIRDEVVRPTIGDGHHDEHDSHAAHGGHDEAAHKAGHPADKYLPFIWSTFFFILICNLLGAIPWLGSPTGHIWVTGVFAVTTLFVVIRAGMTVVGPVGFWKSLVPHMDVPAWLAFFIVPMIWVLEFVGLMIKHGVLAVRLFANIMAGHTVIAVILGFIMDVANSVAFLQAYVFVFLATVFIGTAIHPH